MCEVHEVLLCPSACVGGWGVYSQKCPQMLDFGGLIIIMCVCVYVCMYVCVCVLIPK